MNIILIFISLFFDHACSQLATTPCRNHSDCIGAHQICINFVCVDGQSAGTIPCLSDVQCSFFGNNVGCKFGQCIKATQSTGAYCDNPYQPNMINGFPVACSPTVPCNIPGSQCSRFGYCCITMSAQSLPYCDNQLQQPAFSNGFPVQCTAGQCISLSGYLCSQMGYCCSSAVVGSQMCDIQGQQPFMLNGSPVQCIAGQCNNIPPGYQCSRYNYCCSSSALGNLQYCDSQSNQPYAPLGNPVKCTSGQCLQGYQCSRYNYCCSLSGSLNQYCDSPLQPAYTTNGIAVQCTAGQCTTYPGYVCSRFNYCCSSTTTSNLYCDSPSQPALASNGLPLQCSAGQCINLSGYQCSRYNFCCTSAGLTNQYCDSPSQPLYGSNGNPVQCVAGQCLNMQGYQCGRFNYCCSSTNIGGQYCDSPSQPAVSNGIPIQCNAGQCVNLQGYQCSRFNYCCSLATIGGQYCDSPSQPTLASNGMPVQCIAGQCSNYLGSQCSRFNYCCTSSLLNQYCDSPSQPAYSSNGLPMQCTNGQCTNLGFQCSRFGYCCSSSSVSNQYCDNQLQQPSYQNGIPVRCGSFGQTCTIGTLCSRYGYCCSQSSANVYCDSQSQMPLYGPSGYPLQCSNIQPCNAGYQCSRNGYCCSSTGQFCDIQGQQPYSLNGLPQQCSINGQQCNIQQGYTCSRFGYCCPFASTTPGGYGGSCYSTPCYDQNMECQYGRCLCRQGLSYTGQTCIKLPKLNEICFGFNACDTTNSICSVGGVCICATGYKPDSTATACIKDPKPLSSACQINAECNGAYNRCYNNKCVCQDNFIKGVDNNCKPNHYNCLFGEALRNGKNPIECEIYSSNQNPFQPLPLTITVENPEVKGGTIVELNSTAEQQLKRKERQTIYPPLPFAKLDSCPEKSYCVSYSNSIVPAIALNGLGLRPRGFCCPEPRTVCPVGNVLPYSEGCLNCPDNHFCFTARQGGFGVCCPKPCMNINEVFINGLCVTSSRIGDICYSDEQCTMSRSKCVPSQGTGGTVLQAGRCTCSQGTINSNGICSQAQCRDMYGNPSYPLMDTNGVAKTCSIGYPNACPTTHRCDPVLAVCCPISGTTGGSTNLCDYGSTFTGEYCTQSSLNNNCLNGGRCLYGQTSMMYVCCQ